MGLLRKVIMETEGDLSTLSNIMCLVNENAIRQQKVNKFNFKKSAK